MEGQDEDLTRRDFVKYTVVGAVTAGGLYGLTLRTDAQMKQGSDPDLPIPTRGNGDHITYTYNDEGA